MAKARQISSGRWYIQYYDDEGHRRGRTFDTEREANRFGETTRTHVREGRFIDPNKGKVTVSEWVTELYTLDATLAPQTLSLEESHYRVHVEPRWGPVQLRKVTRTDVEAWLADLIRGEHLDEIVTLKPRTVRRIYGVFAKVINAAVDHSKLDRSPLPPKPKLPRVSRKEERYLTEQEVEHLADCIDPRYRATVFVGCYCGLRISEMAALRVSDIDQLRKRLRVDEAMVRQLDGKQEPSVTKSESSDRSVGINDVALDELSRHISTYVPTGWNDPEAFVFVGEQGGIMRDANYRTRTWYPALEKAEIEKLTPHDMRHTAASFWISDGATNLTVAKQLGHSDTRMVDRVYAHLFDKDIDTLREKSNERAARGRSDHEKAKRQPKGSVIPMRRRELPVAEGE